MAVSQNQSVSQTVPDYNSFRERDLPSLAYTRLFFCLFVLFCFFFLRIRCSFLCPPRERKGERVRGRAKGRDSVDCKRERERETISRKQCTLALVPATVLENLQTKLIDDDDGDE